MLNSLQAFRALACLFIVLHHAAAIFGQEKYFASHPFGALFDCELVALNLLFALSGFIILHAHRNDVGRPDRLGGYLYRRVHRIYPTYWIILAAMLAVYLVVPSFGDGSQRDPGVALRSAFLFPQPSGDPVLAVSWTLCLEMLFYFAFGTFLVHPALGALTFAAWAAMVWIKPFSGYPTNFVQNSYFASIFLGMVACEAFHRSWIRKPGLLTAAGLGILIAAQLTNGFAAISDFLIRLLPIGAGCGLLLAGAATLERQDRLRVPALLTALGDASYSIYLVHFPALSILCKIAKSLRLDARMPHWLLFLSMSVAAVFAGWVFFFLVEKPLRRCGSVKRPKVEAPQPAVEIRRAA
jgi:exopolysaccharide production protein ExoZ